MDLGGSSGAAATVADSAPFTAAGVGIQSSVYGGTIPIIYGATRVYGNLIWYGAFTSIPGKAQSGKGSLASGDKGGANSYTYTASFIWGLAEGPGTINTVYQSKALTTLAGSGLGEFPGSYTQTAWPYLTSYNSAQALTYRGLMYTYGQNYALGSSSQLPNFSFEFVNSNFNSAIAGQFDANPAEVVLDFLTNPHYGAGFPIGAIVSDHFSIFSNYCLATGMVSSPMFDTQQTAASWIDDYVKQHNSEFVWTGAYLTIIPYGDTAVSGNGGSYTPPPVEYSVSDTDYIVKPGEPPVKMTRARPSDQMNSVNLEWLDRANAYNTAVCAVTNQAAVDKFGLRSAQTQTSHYFCTIASVTMSATLQLQRQSIRNQYEFTLGWRYIRLDPMDVIEITDDYLGLEAQPVRILSIEEDENGNLKFTAEESMDGIGSAPLYTFQTGNPYAADYNAAPGSVNAPIILEPPPLLLAANGAYTPAIWVGVSGANPNWGGCSVYLSADNISYNEIGKITVAARQGVLLTALATGTDPDTTNSFSVNLTESQSTLNGGTTGNADDAQTLCSIQGSAGAVPELMSYSAATLIATNEYTLGTYLRRGQFGSAISSHSIGALFCRLDSAIFKYNLPAEYVGKTIYLKFTSFNTLGFAEEELSAVTDYSYAPLGVGTAVQPPTGVGAVMGTYTQPDGTIISYMNVFWSASPDPLFDSYLVEYAPHGTTNWTSVQVGSNVLTVPFNGVQVGAVYDIRVAAVRTTGGPFYSAFDTSASNVVVGKTAAPNPPTGLTVAPQYLSNGLAWTPGSNTDIDSIVVNRGLSATFSASAEIAVVHGGSPWADLGQAAPLTAGTTYYYWIASQDTSGNVSSFDGPVSGIPTLIDTPNIVTNAVTIGSLESEYGTDNWYLFSATPRSPSTLSFVNFDGSNPVNVDISVTVGNASDPGAAPSGSVNGYPFYAPARVIIDVYRVSYPALFYTHISGEAVTIDGGEFTDPVTGLIVTSGTAYLSLQDASISGLHAYAIQVTPFGTLTPGSSTYTFPISNTFIQYQEQKR